MTSEEYFDLKQELKDLRREIREGKAFFKNGQRAYSAQQNEYGCTFGEKKSVTWQEWKEAHSENPSRYSVQLGFLRSLEKLQMKYRYKHVAYSLARGRTLKEIEPKNKQGNEISIGWLIVELKRYNINEDCLLETQPV